jgi:electron transfer flavoprotein alpha subunit
MLFITYLILTKMKNKTMIVLGGVAIALTTTGVLFAQNLNPAAMAEKQAYRATVQTAVETNDYAGLTDEIKDRITEEKFADMVERQSTRDAVKNAIESNDYDAFQSVAGEKMLEKIDSQEAFEQMTARHAAMAAHKTAIEATVQANDYDAFVSAMETHKAAMEANRPDDAPVREAKEIDEEKLQERFEKMVEYYQENGELPHMNHKRHGPHQTNKKG